MRNNLNNNGPMMAATMSIAHANADELIAIFTRSGIVMCAVSPINTAIAATGVSTKNSRIGTDISMSQAFIQYAINVIKFVGQL